MTDRAKAMSGREPARWVGALAVVLLLAIVSPASAGTVPSLASTAQYKAFTAYVKKLDGLAGQPVTGPRKDAYEAELTAKEKAAEHKADALFSRASAVAGTETQAQYKEQAEAVRRSEEVDLEALRAETAAKLERAAASYRLKLERLEHGHAIFEAGARSHVQVLRGKKAKAGSAAQKTAIQAQIAAIIAEVATKRKEESEKRADLKAAYRPQKQAIQAAAAKHETEIGEAAEAKIGKISRHWKSAYEQRKATLNSKRESQLGYLNAKLEKGRADIEAMPAAG